MYFKYTGGSYEGNIIFVSCVASIYMLYHSGLGGGG